MCYECWQLYGAPGLWNERIAAAVALVETIYAEESVGGPMHAVLDDWNIDDDTDFTPFRPDDYSPAVTHAAHQLAGLFTQMTVDERASVLAYHERYVPRPEARP